ncbi:MAG: hypothetical protein IPK66_17255 [Rhodospirillales bacterium]|nr:hypothetical protein [Rhodospirillales bacterium]
MIDAGGQRRAGALGVDGIRADGIGVAVGGGQRVERDLDALRATARDGRKCGERPQQNRVLEAFAHHLGAHRTRLVAVDGRLQDGKEEIARLKETPPIPWMCRARFGPKPLGALFRGGARPLALDILEGHQPRRRRLEPFPIRHQILGLVVHGAGERRRQPVGFVRWRGARRRGRGGDGWRGGSRRRRRGGGGIARAGVQFGWRRHRATAPFAGAVGAVFVSHVL